jgi:hypothetical protein
LNAAIKNANDSISLLQTADGALNETSTMRATYARVGRSFCERHLL